MLLSVVSVWADNYGQWCRDFSQTVTVLGVNYILRGNSRLCV